MVSPNVRPRISVVIPVLNEERNIESLFDRLFRVMHSMGEPFEVICVDDGSTDSTPRILKAEADGRPQLKVVTLARNFGQHAAIIAGFDASAGDWVITIDADLQNPPEEIPRIADEFRKGHDLIGTYREGRKDTLFRKAASWTMNRIVRKFSRIELEDFGCMLRGYSGQVAHAIASHPEYKTFIPALGTLYASNHVEIPVSHARRAAGESKYSFVHLVSLALDLMTCFSLWPLRLLFVCGSVVSTLGIGFGITLLVLRWFFGAAWAAQGVFTLFAVLFIFIGAQFIAFGLLGEYIGRIFQEVRHRPAYILKGGLMPPSDVAAGVTPRAEQWVARAREAALSGEGTVEPAGPRWTGDAVPRGPGAS